MENKLKYVESKEIAWKARYVKKLNYNKFLLKYNFLLLIILKDNVNFDYVF